MIKPQNVDALLSMASKLKFHEKEYVLPSKWLMINSFKLQFNYTEITTLFYDKIKNASESDFVDLVNKRVKICFMSISLVESCWNGYDQERFAYREVRLYLFVNCPIWIFFIEHSHQTRNADSDANPSNPDEKEISYSAVFSLFNAVDHR